MRRLPALGLVLLVLLGVSCFTPASAQTPACADYDAQVWAQSVYESDEDRYATLDTDSDGVACPELPNEFTGFAPTLWAEIHR